MKERCGAILSSRGRPRVDGTSSAGSPCLRPSGHSGPHRSTRSGVGGSWHPARTKKNYQERVYRIKPDSWAERLAETGGSCSICKRVGVDLVTDHDRRCCDKNSSCGKCVRGPLCDICNKRLGFVERNPEIPRSDAEIAYVQAWENRRGRDTLHLLSGG